MRRRWRLGVDRRDCWVGVFAGDLYLYICPLPMLVLRIERAAAVRHRRFLADRAALYAFALSALEEQDQPPLPPLPGHWS